MVKIGFISILIICSSFVFSQRINIGIKLNSYLTGKNKTIYDENTVYYIFSAPYTETVDYTEPLSINQIRLVKINGIYSKLSPIKITTNKSYLLNEDFGISLNYQSKNRFATSLNFNFTNEIDELYYSYQNMVIDIDQNSQNSDSNDNPYEFYYKENSIDIFRLTNTYSLQASYIFIDKYSFKPKIIAGVSQRFIIYSYYNSYIKEQFNKYPNNSTQNIIKLQNNLFQAFADDKYKHFIKFGLGVSIHSLELNLIYNRTVFTQSTHYIYKHYISLGLVYNIISIPINI